MTVLSGPWRRPRPLRATLPRHLRPARRAARSRRPAYHDPFFADPAVVEDDARRFS